MENRMLRRSFSLLAALLVMFSMICAGAAGVNAESEIEEAAAQETTDNIDIPEVMWKGGFQHPVMVYSNGKAAEITKITSSNKNVIQKVKGQDAIKPVNTGKSNVTVSYKYSDSEKGKRTVTVTVKKYPNQIKSLRVNGKKVDTKKNKYDYDVEKYSKTSVKIKMAVKSGWKITDAYGFAYSGKKSMQMAVKAGKIKKGSSIKFPKKYKNANITIIMENKKGQPIKYVVQLFR